MRVRSFACVTFLAALAQVSTAIVVNPTSDANALLGAGLGTLVPGITINGATFTGADGSAGTYSNLMFGPLHSIDHGALMTTGAASIAVGPNDNDSAGIDNGGPNQTFNNYDGKGSNIDLFNVATLSVDFTAASATKLSFDFSFGSEEYYYYTNSPYNDSFFAFLDGGNKTLSLDSNGNPITIDNQFLTIDNRPSTFDPTNGYGLPDKPGTGTLAGITELQYDGFTPVLRTTFSVGAGTHNLSFVIGDAGDGVLDSGVFLSHIFTNGNQNGDDGSTGVVPAPGAIFVFAAGLLARRRRTRR